MPRLRILLLAVALGLLALPAPAPALTVGRGVDPPRCRVDPATGQRVCCRVCSRGKACGNSCIARDRTCHRGVGCACDAGSAAPAERPAAAAPASGQVAEAQRALNALGYDAGPADGRMDARTRAALRAFQRDQEMEPDGLPGPATLERLRRELARRR